MRDAPRWSCVRSVCSQARKQSTEDRRRAQGQSYLHRWRDERDVRQCTTVAGPSDRASSKNGRAGDAVYHSSGTATQYRGMVEVSQRPHRSRLHRVDVRFHDRGLVRATNRAQPKLGKRLFHRWPISLAEYLA